MPKQVGAELVDMDQVQIHPSLGADTNILVSEASRGAGAIMVNREGKRFINELTTRDAGFGGNPAADRKNRLPHFRWQCAEAD